MLTLMTLTPRQYFLIVLLVFLVACGNERVAPPTETPIQTGVLATPIPTLTLIPATEFSTQLPPQPTIAFITPDPIQVERWKEYEVALAQGILPTFSSEPILCEWDILAQSSQEVYVWAVCASPKVSDLRPVVIHLDVDGSVQGVEIPKRGSSSDIDRMFPEEVQMKFSLYTGNSLFNGRLKEMLNHLSYRETHPEEPPLIVLSAMSTATSTP